MLLVVGNTTLDTTLRVGRLPVPGETVLAESRSDGLGGKGANQAVTAARYGAATRFVSAVGTDADGDRALHILAAEGIGPDWIRRIEGPTDRSYITVAPDGENAIVSTHGAAAALSAADVDAALASLGPDDAVLLQGNLSLDVTRHCLRSARTAGARTMVNPAPIHFSYDGLWPLVDMCILNAIEVADLSGNADPVAGGRALRSSGAGIVVVTVGADGAAVIGETVDTIPSPRVTAVDTTGAGDVFCGVLAAAVAGGSAIVPAVRRAAAAASLCVTRPGAHAAIPTADELARLRCDDGAAP